MRSLALAGLAGPRERGRMLRGEFPCALVRPAFAVADRGILCCTDSLGLRILAGIEVRLP